MALQTINGTGIYSESIGEGLPLLMMHGGLGLDHSYFRPYFDQLSDNAKVIFYDHRGNGRSEKPADYGTLTHDVLIDDAVAVLNFYGVEKAVVFGHSYGGFLAQQLAIKHADRLSGLILANTVPVVDYQPVPNGTEEQLAAFGAAFTRPMDDDKDWRKTWTTFSQMYYRSYDDETGQRIDSATHYCADEWNAGNAALATFNAVEGLPTVNVPTLVLSGEHDFICPTEHGGSRISSLIPNAELSVFDKSAHFPFIEQEKEFFEVIRKWLPG